MVTECVCSMFFVLNREDAVSEWNLTAHPRFGFPPEDTPGLAIPPRVAACQDGRVEPAPSETRPYAHLSIRRATLDDAAGIWSILEPTIRAGETYALDPNLSEAEALSYWMGADKDTFVAEEHGVILGTYYLRQNQAGGGAHVCNCGYMTSSAASGRGIARLMCQHSLEHARGRGFKAMQFNFVVSANERAVRLWESLGFETVGRLPLAFRHPALGYVDALVMFRVL